MITILIITARIKPMSTPLTAPIIMTREESEPVERMKENHVFSNHRNIHTCEIHSGCDANAHGHTIKENFRSMDFHA